MPPKKKSASKRKSPKLKKSTPQPSDPLPIIVEEISPDNVSSPTEENAASKKETAPLAAIEESKEIKMLENPEIEVENILAKSEQEKNSGEEEKEDIKEVEGEGNEMGEAVANELEKKDAKGADVEDNEIRKVVGEEAKEKGASREEAIRSDGEKSVRKEDATEKQEEGDKQIAMEETCEGESICCVPQSSRSGSKKQKEFELHIGGLDKRALEEDLIKVFGVFGEIQSVRIIKHPVTQKSRGFAFIQYVSIEHAKKALAELKDGVEIKGKKIRVSAPQYNVTLYVENICKNWTKERVLEALKGYGVEQIEELRLPDDPNNKGNIQGFAFLEFKTQIDAMEAFQHLKKPGVVFGLDTCAKVSFAGMSLEDPLKVKTIFMEGIPNSWDESKVEELCRQYGKIERTELLRNSRPRKRKDIGFVEFSSQDSAVACIEGINNAHFGENINVKASLALPRRDSQLSKQSQGRFKLQKNDEHMIVDDKTSRAPEKISEKGKVIHNKKEKRLNEKSATKTSSEPKENKKEKRTFQTAQPSFKKARKNYKGKEYGESSTGFTSSRSSYPSHTNIPHQSTYNLPRSYRTPAYTGNSVPQIRSNDLEPHAGFLQPANQVRSPYGYDERRAGTYHLQPTSGSAYSRDGAVNVVQSFYPGYSSNSGHQAGSVYPSSGAYAYPRPYYR